MKWPLNQLTLATPEFSNSEDGFQVKSQLINKSQFSFWNLGVIVLAYQQDKIVAANAVVLEQVKTGSTRPFEVTWPTAISSPQQVKLMPLVNVYDESNYMPFSSFDQPSDPSGVEFSP